MPAPPVKPPLDQGRPRDAAGVAHRNSSCLTAAGADGLLDALLGIETVGFAWINPEGRIIEANDAFLAMGGYDREDLDVGALTWLGLTPPEWIKTSSEAMAQIRTAGQSAPYEKEYFRKDGSRWCGLIAGRILPDKTVLKIVLDITSRKQTEQALEAELKAMRRLQDLSRQVVNGAGLQPILDGILDATMELHSADFGSVRLYDPGTGKVSIAAQRGFPTAQSPALAPQDAAEESACSAALAHRKRIVIDDLERERGFLRIRKAGRALGYRAVHSTPLLAPSGETLGLLSTYYRQPHHASELDVRLADVYARLASDAIARARAEAELQQSRAQLAQELESARQLQRISSEILVEHHPEALYGKVIEAMMAIMNSDGASMQILLPETGELKLLSWRGFHPASAAFWDRVDANSASTCGEALREGQRILVADVEACDFMAGTEDLAAYRLSNLRAVQSTPLRSRTGRALGMVSTHWRLPHQPTEDEFSRFDVLAREAADLIERAHTEVMLREGESHARLLLAELQHRVRNTLAVVRAIARQTAEGGESAADYAMHLDGRLAAIARVQIALTRDPAAGLSLSSLVSEELLSSAPCEGDRFSLPECDVRLRSKAGEVLGLAIHELAANAVKFGALSSPKGHVTVAWGVVDGEGDRLLRIEWTETGVPVLSAAPRRSGFGTEVLTQLLPYQLGGTAALTFRPGGLACSIEFPAKWVLS